MHLHPHQVYHVYNRGNNRKRLFYEKENYPYFISKIKKYIAPNCDILAYCLLPNHFHFLIHANETTILPYEGNLGVENVAQKNPMITMSRFSHGVQILLSSYAKAINKRYKRTGSLFAQNTHARMTSSESFLEDYCLWCFVYIHNNPVEAGLVDSPEKWSYSSYREYMGLVKNPVCNLELGRVLLSLDMNKLLDFRNLEVPDHIIHNLK